MPLRLDNEGAHKGGGVRNTLARLAQGGELTRAESLRFWFLVDGRGSGGDCRLPGFRELELATGVKAIPAGDRS